MGIKDDPKHGANRVLGSVKKKGENKGIKAAKIQERKNRAYSRGGDRPKGESGINDS